LVFGFGRKDLASDPGFEERKRAYDQAYSEERLRLAKVKGQTDALKAANRKPFYQKLGGAAVALGKDMISSKHDASIFSTPLGTDSPRRTPSHRKRPTHTKKKRRRTSPKGNDPLGLW
jgi:hypothetical protein